MSEELFNLADEYDAMVQQGLRLTGETKDYFARERVKYLARTVPNRGRVKRILDFGCGIGGACALLADAFPRAQVVGVDTAEPALELAAITHGSDRVTFQHVDDFRCDAQFDLCYVSAVFHHIEPHLRGAALDCMFRALKPEGVLAFFEHNPWNPGTRMVMRRIPFDRDAQTLTLLAAKKLLGSSGYRVARTRGFFYFPRALRWLRWLEPVLAHVPLGGQYLLLAHRMPEHQLAPAAGISLAAS